MYKIKNTVKILNKFKNSFINDKHITNNIIPQVKSSCFLYNRNKTNLTISDAYNQWNSIFIKNNITESEESITNILAHVMNTRRVSDVKKYKDNSLTEAQETYLTKLCTERLKKIPIQYVIGEWDFRFLTLKMRPPVFIPRPETEMLVDLVLEEIKARDNVNRVLELCCGSGAISLSLLKEVPDLQVVAVDYSKAACKLTEENARNLKLNDRLTVIEGTIGKSDLKIPVEKFGIIVSNPPYIFTNDMKTLQPEITLYEDLKALDGGDDGLDVIKNICHLSSKLLDNNGKLFLEVDPRHPEMIEKWVSDKGDKVNLVYESFHKDFCNKPRFVRLIKK